MSSHIYEGVWTNWSQGRIYGATLTLSARNAAFLTAFLAMFVTLVGVQFWGFLCFVVHQVRSTAKEKDKSFHEYQVILRNAATPAAGAWAFVKQGLRGTKYRRTHMLRALPWAVSSAAYLAAFSVAALFSSRISKSPGDARLIRGSACGVWQHPSDNSADSYAKQANDTYTSASYARECYSDNPNAPQCAKMPVPMIPYTMDRNASCPFASGLCFYGDTAALNMTSRLIDSYKDLGINTPPEDRVLYQFSKTCAPIHTKGHVIDYIATAEDLAPTGDWILEYQLGWSVIGSSLGRYKNATSYVYNNHSITSNGGYVVDTLLATAGQTADSTQWIPIPELNRTDADVSIVFLEANTIAFLAANNDPIFGAHISSGDIFEADAYVTTMACAEQFRVCNPVNDICTPYLGVLQIADYLASSIGDLSMNTRQKANMLRVLFSTPYTLINTQVERRLSAALRAMETTYGKLQFPLPDDQWIVETSSWFETSLARFQLSSLEYAAGPSNPAFGKYYQPQDYPGLSELCDAQIVRDSMATTSFSVLGLAIVFALGGLAIALNLLADPVVGFVQRATKVGRFKRDCWLADDVMSLQTAALESRLQLNMSTSPFYHNGELKHQELGRLRSSNASTLAGHDMTYEGTAMITTQGPYKYPHVDAYSRPPGQA